MKQFRWLSLMLACLLLVFAAACKKNDAPSAGQSTAGPTVGATDRPTAQTTDRPTADTSTAPSGNPTQDATGAPSASPGDAEMDTLDAVLDRIYAAVPNFEIMLGPATAIDLEDAASVKIYLGLDNADGIREAVFSEPMMSSIAYSVCLVRVEKGTDVEALKKSMVDGVDPAKWICVAAEKVAAVDCDDLILLVMSDTTLTDSILNAFSTTMNGNVGTAVTRMVNG